MFDLTHPKYDTDESVKGEFYSESVLRNAPFSKVIFSVVRLFAVLLSQCCAPNIQLMYAIPVAGVVVHPLHFTGRHPVMTGP